MPDAPSAQSFVGDTWARQTALCRSLAEPMYNNYPNWPLIFPVDPKRHPFLARLYSIAICLGAFFVVAFIFIGDHELHCEYNDPQCQAWNDMWSTPATPTFPPPETWRMPTTEFNPPTATPLTAPTPLPVEVTWITYQNTEFNYSLSYPRNWVLNDATGAGNDIEVTNFSFPISWNDVKPPLILIEIDAIPNPHKLAPLAYFEQNGPLSGGGLIFTKRIVSTSARNVNGLPAAQIVFTSDDTGSYSNIVDVIAHDDTIFYITQFKSGNGQPSPVFTQMAASFTASACPNCWG